MSGNGCLLWLTNNQRIIVRDLILKGRSTIVHGEDNTHPLIYGGIYGGSLELKGETAITGNALKDNCGAGVYLEGSGTLIMQDNSKVYGNISGYSGGNVFTSGNIIMRDNASVYENIHGGIMVSGTLTMLDNTSVYNNTTKLEENYYNSASGIGGNSIIMSNQSSVFGNSLVGIRCNVLTMQDNASVTDNGGCGIIVPDKWSEDDDYGLILRDYATVTGNKGGGVAGTVNMTDHASVMNNILTMDSNPNWDRGGAGIMSSSSITMSGNAVVSNNVLIGHPNNIRVGGGGINGKTVTLRDNVKIIGNTCDNANGGGVIATFIDMHNNAEISNNSASGYNGYTGLGGGVYIRQGNDSDISIIGGSAKISDNTSREGGGIYTNSMGTLNIQDNAIITNNSSLLGGGINASSYGGSVNIQENAIIANNNAEIGGGLYIMSTYYDKACTFTMRDHSLIIGNTSITGGGGIYSKHTNITMRDYAKVTGNTISGDRSTDGGGICYYGDDSDILIMQDYAEISNNIINNDRTFIGILSADGGGGLYLVKGTAILKDNAAIKDNEVTGIYNGGGGVFVWGDGSLWLQDNSIISGNKAQRGGGVYTYKWWDNETSKLHMQGNPVISNNIASIEGGGVNIDFYTIFQISGGTIYGNMEGDNSNRVNNGVNINGSGAALFKDGPNAVTQFGTFNDDIFTPNGDLTTSDTTIRVKDGVLQ